MRRWHHSLTQSHGWNFTVQDWLPELKDKNGRLIWTCDRTGASPIRWTMDKTNKKLTSVLCGKAWECVEECPFPWIIGKDRTNFEAVWRK